MAQDLTLRVKGLQAGTILYDLRFDFGSERA